MSAAATSSSASSPPSASAAAFAATTAKPPLYSLRGHTVRNTAKDDSSDIAQKAQTDRIAHYFRKRFLKTIESFTAIFHKQITMEQGVESTRDQAGTGPGISETEEQQFFRRNDIVATIKLFSMSKPEEAIFTYFAALVHFFEDNWKNYPELHKPKAHAIDQAWDFLVRVFAQMTQARIQAWNQYLKQEQLKEVGSLLQKSTSIYDLLEKARNLKDNTRFAIFHEMRVRLWMRLQSSREKVVAEMAQDLVDTVLNQRELFLQSELLKVPNGSADHYLVGIHLGQLIDFKNASHQIQALGQAFIIASHDILHPVCY